jgi:hypothetical protein
LHVVLLVFLLLGLWKKSLRGRGIWYSGGALLACHVSLFLVINSGTWK